VALCLGWGVVLGMDEEWFGLSEDSMGGRNVRGGEEVWKWWLCVHGDEEVLSTEQPLARNHPQNPAKPGNHPGLRNIYTQLLVWSRSDP